jgi:hypothetical protein
MARSRGIGYSQEHLVFRIRQLVPPLLTEHDKYVFAALSILGLSDIQPLNVIHHNNQRKDQ